MKRIHAVAVITALTMLVLMLTACGKSEFSASADTGKRMTITAQNAAKEARCITGALEVAEGEQITVRANLTKGSVQYYAPFANAVLSLNGVFASGNGTESENRAAFDWVEVRDSVGAR